MESKWHRLVCNLIYDLLRVVFGDRVLLGLDQFIYWDASDPQKKAAPDVFGRPNEPDRIFPSWKVWDLGAPAFVFEVVSDSSWPEDVAEKPALYDSLGARELIVFDPGFAARQPTAEHEPRALRAWRRIDGALVEVDLGDDSDRYFAETLGLWVRVCPSEEETAEGRLLLRLGQGERGEDLVPTPEARGEARGRAAGKAEDVLTVLAARGLEIPDPIRARVLACADLATLDRWITRAVAVESAAAVIEEDDANG